MFLNTTPIKKPLKHRRLNKRANQQGSMLVLAIFVLVVFLLLGTTLTKILSSGDESITYEVIGIRAYAAANSGAEFALQKLFPLNGSVVQACSAIGTPPNISNVTGLFDCYLTVTCSQFSTPDSVTHYKITSLGECKIDDNNSTSREVVIEARTL